MSYSIKHDDLILASPFNAVALPDYGDTIVNALNLRRNILERALDQFATRAALLAEVAALLIETLQHGHKVPVAGNGGSPSEAQHRWSTSQPLRTQRFGTAWISGSSSLRWRGKSLCSMPSRQSAGTWAPSTTRIFRLASGSFLMDSTTFLISSRPSGPFIALGIR